MKIVVNMACGLANRMFQYSYYLYLKKLGYNVQVDFYRTAKLPHEEVAWEDIFPKATIDQASSWLILKLGGGTDLLSKIYRRYFPLFHHVVYMPTAFDAILPTVGKNKYMIGVFQNVEMVEKVKQEVEQAFTFKPFVNDTNYSLMQELERRVSVAIHVRKGEDYSSRIWYQNTCPLEYYQRAVALMCEKLVNPYFYVFTDNPAWVKENFVDIEYTLVERNPTVGYGCHFDMQLMSYCKHNIISNSTYAWWGAYLNKNPEKIIIGPHVWLNPNSCADFTSERILDERWIVL